MSQTIYLTQAALTSGELGSIVVWAPVQATGKGKSSVAKGFRTQSFSDRAHASAAAKRALVEKHKAAPKPDPVELAASNERRLAREAEAAAAREQARTARDAAARAAEETASAEAEAAAAAAKAAQPKVPSQAELKAARDARYSARKARGR